VRYEIVLTETARNDLRRLRAFERATVLDRIASALGDEPTVTSRNRKRLLPARTDDEPVWEYRIGELRIFYDVDDGRSRVSVQAVRFKGRLATNEVFDEISDDR